MWDFIDRLINIVLLRQRDFQGISPDSVDGRGNYSIGLRWTIGFSQKSTTTKLIMQRDGSDNCHDGNLGWREARRLLALMSMPFKRAA